MNQKMLFLAACLAAAMSAAIAMSGCSAEPEPQQEPEIEYVDDNVINALGEGLEARWDMVGSESYVPETMLDDAIRIEIDALSEFTDAPYQDKELQELVLSYANTLGDTLEIWDLFEASPEYAMKWEGLYDDRTQKLKAFVNDYGLTVSPKHEAQLANMLVNATTAEKLDNEREAVESLVASMAFEPTEETGYYCEYGAVVTNNTGHAFKHLSIGVSVYDAESIRIEDAFIYVENWGVGETVKLTFTADPEIASYKLTLNDYVLA